MRLQAFANIQVRTAVALLAANSVYTAPTFGLEAVTESASPAVRSAGPVAADTVNKDDPTKSPLLLSCSESLVAQITSASHAKVVLGDNVWPTGGYAGPNGDDDSHSEEQSADEERTALPDSQQRQPPPPHDPPSAGDRSVADSGKTRQM